MKMNTNFFSLGLSHRFVSLGSAIMKKQNQFRGHFSSPACRAKKKLKLYSLFSVYCDKGKSNEVNHELHTPSKAEGIKVHALLMAEEEFPFSLAVI